MDEYVWSVRCHAPQKERHSDSFNSFKFFFADFWGIPWQLNTWSRTPQCYPFPFHHFVPWLDPTKSLSAYRKPRPSLSYLVMSYMYLPTTVPCLCGSRAVRPFLYRLNLAEARWSHCNRYYVSWRNSDITNVSRKVSGSQGDQNISCFYWSKRFSTVSIKVKHWAKLI
jgi:hypothetical protein